MKKLMKPLAVLLAAAMCVGIFAACTSTTTANGSEDSADTNVTEADTAEETTEEAEAEAEPEEDVIGKVSYVYDSMLTLEVYAPADGSEVTDYTAVDVAALEATGETEYPYIFEDTEYYYVSDGALTALTAEDVAEEQMVAVITTEEGIQQVYILSGYTPADANPDETEDTQEDAAETEDETEEGSVLPDLNELKTEETIVAEVNEITEDGTLMLYLYGLDTGCEDYVITDYANVELDNYVYVFDTMEYSISATATVYIAEDGELTPASAAVIAVDDMLVIYPDNNGMECIAVYQSNLSVS